MAVVSTQAQQADAVRQALQISSERASHSQRAEELLRDDEQVPDLLDRGHAPKLQDGGVAEAGVEAAGLAHGRAEARCAVVALARTHPLDGHRLARVTVPRLGDGGVGRSELL